LQAKQPPDRRDPLAGGTRAVFTHDGGAE
jgi:hypothetical protein